MTSETTNGSLYDKILSKEGISGLLLFMFATFTMTIVYQNLKEQKVLLADIKQEEAKQTRAQEETNQILQDIRYSLRENGGLTFRNNAL